jgi:hypothetical protein
VRLFHSFLAKGELGEAKEEATPAAVFRLSLPFSLVLHTVGMWFGSKADVSRVAGCRRPIHRWNVLASCLMMLWSGPHFADAQAAICIKEALDVCEYVVVLGSTLTTCVSQTMVIVVVL